MAEGNLELDLDVTYFQSIYSPSTPPVWRSLRFLYASSSLDGVQLGTNPSVEQNHTVGSPHAPALVWCPQLEVREDLLAADRTSDSEPGLTQHEREIPPG